MELRMGKKMVGADVAPPSKPKKGGVIPPKRRLVDSILQSIATLLCPHRHPSSSDTGINSPSNKSTENVKNKKIFPHGGHQLFALQKNAIFDVLKTSSKTPCQNFLTWQKLKRQKS
jgi:hypothetical protein